MHDRNRLLNKSRSQIDICQDRSQHGEPLVLVSVQEILEKEKLTEKLKNIGKEIIGLGKIDFSVKTDPSKPLIIFTEPVRKFEINHLLLADNLETNLDQCLIKVVNLLTVLICRDKKSVELSKEETDLLNLFKGYNVRIGTSGYAVGFDAIDNIQVIDIDPEKRYRIMAEKEN